MKIIEMFFFKRDEMMRIYETDENDKNDET